MRSKSLSAIRLLVILMGLPALVLWAVFLVCYSPFYLLLYLISHNTNKNEETMASSSSSSSKANLNKLQVKHA